LFNFDLAVPDKRRTHDPDRQRLRTYLDTALVTCTCRQSRERDRTLHGRREAATCNLPVAGFSHYALSGAHHPAPLQNKARQLPANTLRALLLKR
jgi:hypothetical protein